MRRRSFIAAAFLAPALAIWLLACGDEPASPNQPSAIPPDSIARLEIIGPESVPPGGMVQFRATAHMGDGSTRDVTDRAVWQGGNPAILTVSPTGVVSGRQRGETSLAAELNLRRATRQQLFVLPDGTYKLSGVVKDDGVPVSGAQVVSVGPGETLTTTTPANGTYRLYGVVGPTELRATKSGYQEESRKLDISRHDVVDLDLRLMGPRALIDGTYTLQVSAAANCATLADEARTRSYTAVLEQKGPVVAVTLSGASFATGKGRVLNGFSGTVESTRIVFSANAGSTYYYFYVYDYPAVLEQLPQGTSYSFDGTAQVAVGGSRMAGTLNGVIGTYTPTLRPLTNCRATDHPFVLSR